VHTWPVACARLLISEMNVSSGQKHVIDVTLPRALGVQACFLCACVCVHIFCVCFCRVLCVCVSCVYIVRVCILCVCA